MGNKIRGFEYIKGYEDKVKLPVRATKCSAGYDFFALEDIIIEPHYKSNIDFIYDIDESISSPVPASKISIVPTGIKVYLPYDEFLQLQVRSSLGKKGLIIPNSPGIIDADYILSGNEGHIHGMFINLSDSPITIKKGERFMQGIFQKYYLTDNDYVNTERNGGLGSTNK